MTYAMRVTVDVPVSMYDAVHAGLLERTQGRLDGLLVHIGRPTASGFEVIEVWDSREAYERCDRDVIAPLISELSAGGSPGSGPTPQQPQQHVEEFALRGLVIPRGGVVI